MKRTLGATGLALLLVGCGSSVSISSPSPVPSQEAPASAAASASVPSSRAEGFILCPSASTGATCPLPPGEYTAGIHDAFMLTIKDAGWQEERGEGPSVMEPTIILSRIDAPDQRLLIDTGQTSQLLDEAAMAALLDGTAAFQQGAPSPTEVGGASGFQVDLAPTEAGTISVRGAGAYELKPDHRYRVAALQLPMIAESGIKVIVIEAPTAGFDAFAPLADAVLQTVRFSSGS